MIRNVILSEFFDDFQNMHATGMSIAQCVQSLKETSGDRRLKNVLLNLEERIREGDGITEAIVRTNAFPWIVPTTLRAGEQAGDLQGSFKILAQYFRRSNDAQGKLMNALIYPIIVFVFLVAVMLFISLRVIPTLENLLPPEAMSHGATRWMLGLSAAIQKYWSLFLTTCIAYIVFIAAYCKRDRNAFEIWLYQWPVVGNIVKEACMAQYFLNLSVLLKSGVPLLRALNDLNAVHATPISKRFFHYRDYMFGGMPFWEAVRADAFFTNVVIFTLRRGEEMSRLDEYCFNLSEYFNKRTAEKVLWLTHLIQPALLAFAGSFLVLIAFSFLVPIYGNLNKMAGG